MRKLERSLISSNELMIILLTLGSFYYTVFVKQHLTVCKNNIPSNFYDTRRNYILFSKCANTAENVRHVYVMNAYLSC